MSLILGVYFRNYLFYLFGGYLNSSFAALLSTGYITDLDRVVLGIFTSTLGMNVPN